VRAKQDLVDVALVRPI